MSTRRQRSQHAKGKKRPGHWHQGASLGRQQSVALRRLAAAEQQGRAHDDELRKVAARYNEDIDVWQDQLRAAPFVPRFEAAL